MWNDTVNGSVRQFETRQKEVVMVEIKKKEGVAVVVRPTSEQVIAGVRDNKVKIWNDLLFDPVSYNQIKTKMESLVVKKDTAANNKSKRR
ncbi:MAG: hypothetical protein K2G70_00395 [Turicibacter sp.]|nr:hypothetical protein [Turicibacter sp.]